jgi:uncharacterized protein with HEPN domain
VNNPTDVDRLEDMRGAIEDILALTGSGKDAFVANRTAQQAVAFNLAVLGEAARAISDEFRRRHAEIPWRDVIAQRNTVIHEYHRLNLDRIWATEDVPLLREQLAAIVPPEAGHEPEQQS